jgi:hypothetical protein
MRLRILKRRTSNCTSAFVRLDLNYVICREQGLCEVLGSEEHCTIARLQSLIP